MITKRLFSIIFAMPMAVSSFADSGLSGLSDAADGVGSYLPYVQGVCYVIAAVIAVAGAMSISCRDSRCRCHEHLSEYADQS